MPWIVIGIVREASDDDTTDAYYVRAIFDNASTIVQGEDVKIAGVPVGVVSDMNVTEDEQAAVTLRIDDEDFTPWKADASCTIRRPGSDRREVRGVRAGLDRTRPRCARSRRATARASACCRSRTRARRSTST